MNILSIETATEHGSVALLHGDELLVRRIQGAANHSEAVLRDLRELLAEAGLAVSQLDAVAFGAGPGAFTGLRLACGVAQGVALAADLGVAAVGSLQALALQVGAPRVLAATDARMGEIYCATFVCDGEGVPRLQGTLRCCAPLDLELPPGEWSAAGSAFRAWPEELEARTAGRLVACQPDLYPRAEEVARLGAIQARDAVLVAPELAAPLYVRDKVALTTAERRARGGARLMQALAFAPMREEDLDWVSAREAELHAHPWSRGNFADSLASGYDAWVLTCDGVSAGYAIVMNVLDEAHLLDIGIVAALQGRGLAMRFLDWLAEGAKARGACDFYLEVRPSNAAALRLYARSGFVEIGRRRGYYPGADGREDAIVMRRTL